MPNSGAASSNWSNRSLRARNLASAEIRSSPPMRYCQLAGASQRFQRTADRSRFRERTRKFPEEKACQLASFLLAGAPE
jgi:hypothetical protein